MYKGTNNHSLEPNSVETLDLETSYCHYYNEKEYVRIAVIPEDARGENGTISLVLVQFDKEYKCTCPQACLTAQEIDLVIKGLLEAKKRMEKINSESSLS